MANQAPITPAALAATFDAAHWLSHFESIGGGFLATESQTSLCIACQGTSPENQSAAHAMLRGLTDEQRAEVIVHIRERAGLSAPQPDLKAVCSQGVSEAAGISPLSSGQALGQSEGSYDMDMTHSFTPALSDAAAAKFEAANHAYVAADKAMNDFDQQYLKPASDQWSAWRDQWPIKTPDSNAEYVASREAASALYKPVQGQFDQLVDVRSSALMGLIAAPAPHIAAITRKVQVLVDAEEWDGGDCESHLKHILADLQTLGEGNGHSASAASDAIRTWRRAMNHLVIAKKRYDAHETLCESEGEEDDRLGRVLYEREQVLMKMQAPNWKALHWKLHYLQNTSDGETIDAAVFAQVLGDADRLAVAE